MRRISKEHLLQAREAFVRALDAGDPSALEDAAHEMCEASKDLVFRAQDWIESHPGSHASEAMEAVLALQDIVRATTHMVGMLADTETRSEWHTERAEYYLSFVTDPRKVEYRATDLYRKLSWR